MNARLRINHTIHMPAEIGPKRDCALARAGCYFDSSTTVCGAEVFALRRESDAADRFDHRRLRNIEGAAFDVTDEGIVVALDLSSVIASEAKQSVLSFIAAARSTPLTDVNVDVEIDIADAGLRRAMRAALMPASPARAGIADIGQLQASPLRQRS